MNYTYSPDIVSDCESQVSGDGTKNSQVKYGSRVKGHYFNDFKSVKSSDKDEIHPIAKTVTADRNNKHVSLQNKFCRNKIDECGLTDINCGITNDQYYKTWLNIFLNNVQLPKMNSENATTSDYELISKREQYEHLDEEPIDLSYKNIKRSQLNRRPHSCPNTDNNEPDYDSMSSKVIDLSLDGEFRKRYYDRIQQAQQRLIQHNLMKNSNLPPQRSYQKYHQQQNKCHGSPCKKRTRSSDKPTEIIAAVPSTRLSGSFVKNNNVCNQSNTGLKKDFQSEMIAYRERRRRNNEAAKRSRDARRAKEDEIALHAAFLERENARLKLELSKIKQESAKLKCLIDEESK
ncbi:hypothetical protein GJ496_009852 [Pomphorhynchus laevis]|nr:hypothetical protein GJ496_009852 [Pomphorhynchus laevis]